MAYNRDNSKYGKFTNDFDDFSDNRVEFFLPDEDIDFNVLASDLKCYLGNDAEVNIGNHPRNGRPGYYIKSAVSVTMPMIQDLKADSLRWRAERRQYNLKDYNESRTHEKRLKNGPSEKAPKVTSYKQGEGREQQDKFLQGPAAPQPIPKSRHEREDLYRNPTTMSSSPRSNLPPRTSSHYPSTNPSRHEDTMYVSEPTALMSKTSQNYPAPSKGFKPPSRRHQEDTSDLSAGSISMNYRQTETSIQVNESALRRPSSGNQYSTQPRYTEQQREEVEKQIEELLRAHGIPNPSQQYVDDLVKEQLRRLYGSQQQQSHQTPLSPTQGGQKPSSGSVPYTHFTGSSGQQPPPRSVPLTQFHGSGGKNPPPGSVPYTQFPGSDKPPDTTQPDFSGSYGFSHITSGGPESYLVDADNEGFSDQPYSQSYEPRSGKHSTRDGKDRQRR